MIKREKLEKYLTVILLTGLILFVIWRFDFLGLLSQRIERAEIEKKLEIWMKAAKENLEEDFVFMEGKNYFFAKGKLVSECTEPDPASHCPISLRGAKINDNSLFVSGFNFATPTLDIYPYPITEGINVLGFLEKNHSDSVSLEFEILDYIPNTTLCERPHDKQNLCNINWTKKVFLDEPILAEGLSVKITDFDYSFLDKELKLSLKGETESGEALDVILSVYRDFKSKKSLINKRDLEPEDSGDVYRFEFTGSFNISDLETSYSVLLLMTGENSFHAKEWIFDDGEVVNTIVYK